MIVTERDRRSNIEVTVIDVEKFLATLLKRGKASGEIPENVKRISVYNRRLCYVETPIGIFVLDEESCTPRCNETPLKGEASIPLDLYYRYSENSIALFPSASIDLTEEFVRSLPTKGTQNFGEWVRQFGARLEHNFHNWNQFLEETLGVRPPRKKAQH